jgi:hypothetical protein
MEPHAESGAYFVTVPLRNQGNRPYWLGGDRVKTPRPSGYVLERQIAEDNWAPAGTPTGAVVDGLAVALDLVVGLAVQPDAEVGVRHELAPGTYRIRLTPEWGAEDALENAFKLEPFKADLESFFPAEPDEGAASSANRGSGVMVELRGVLDGQASQPKFSLILTLPDGTERREQFMLGDTLYGTWTISEFSPAHNTMTLSDGKRLLVVERGKPEEIPAD